MFLENINKILTIYIEYCFNWKKHFVISHLEIHNYTDL